MAKAKKLKSGSWHCQVMVDGKRKSFTVNDPTRQGKYECERLAAEWKATVQDKTPTGKTVEDALADYISLKQQSLSASTLRSYRIIANNAYNSILKCKIEDLDNRIVQGWIDEYKKTHKPKTVANAYGLLEAALYEAAAVRFKIRLPDRQEPEYFTPTDEDVKHILNEVKGTELEKAVLLAAFGTLRRGEICALRREDIKGSTVTVSKAVVWTGYENALKPPKTASSVRTVNLPPKVIKTLLRDCERSDGMIVNMTPTQLSNAFRRAVRRAGIPHFRFHDLRAYSASIRHALGIPDQYIMADGGWKTDTVLKKVYRRSMEDKRKEFSKVTNSYFNKIY